MEQSSDRQPFSSFDPDDEPDGIPRAHVQGWIKIELSGGRTAVWQVKEVKVLERQSLEVIRPGKEDFPLYKSGFVWSSIEHITEEEALALLARRRQQRRPAPPDDTAQ